MFRLFCQGLGFQKSEIFKNFFSTFRFLTFCKKVYTFSSAKSFAFLKICFVLFCQEKTFQLLKKYFWPCSKKILSQF